MASMFEIDPVTPKGGQSGASPASELRLSDLAASLGHGAMALDTNDLGPGNRDGFVEDYTYDHASRLAAEARCGSTAHSPLALAQLIEGEIIPRLLMAHRCAPLPDPAFAASPVDSAAIADVERDVFVTLVLQHEVHALLASIETLLDRGVSLDSVYLDLLAPAARTLGEYWEADRCDFVDVTMGLWRLQQIVHELGQRGQRDIVASRADRRAFFTVAPGDQHSFGVVMIEDFFRRAGWQTASAPAATFAELVDLVATRWLELIGLTVSCVAHIDTLPPMIAALRERSRNPALLVMVGGRIFTEQPGLAARVGADGTAPDGKQAVLSAENLLGQLVDPPPGASSRAIR